MHAQLRPQAGGPHRRLRGLRELKIGDQTELCKKLTACEGQLDKEWREGESRVEVGLGWLQGALQLSGGGHDELRLGRVAGQPGAIMSSPTASYLRQGGKGWQGQEGMCHHSAAQGT